MSTHTLILQDNQPVEAHVFEGTGQRVVCIDDRSYRVYQDGDCWYFMVRAQYPRSVRGDWPTLLRALCEIHLVYKAYETTVRKAKEAAQMSRDRRIHEIAEHVSKSPNT